MNYTCIMDFFRYMASFERCKKAEDTIDKETKQVKQLKQLVDEKFEEV